MLNPNDIHQKLVTLGEGWSEMNYAAELLEETKKTTLAQLTLKSTASSMAAKETEALASPEYDEHVRKMVKARMHANKAKVGYESAKVSVDMLRTQNANELAANRSAV